MKSRWILFSAQKWDSIYSPKIQLEKLFSIRNRCGFYESGMHWMNIFHCRIIGCRHRRFFGPRPPTDWSYELLRGGLKILTVSFGSED